MDQNEIIKLAVQEYKPNYRFSQTNINFVEFWMLRKNNSDPLIRQLLTALNVQFGPGFDTWWENLYQFYINDLTVRDIFETVIKVSTNDDVLYLGKNSIPPTDLTAPERNKLFRKLKDLCDYLIGLLNIQVNTGSASINERSLNRSTQGIGSKSTSEVPDTIIPDGLLKEFDLKQLPEQYVNFAEYAKFAFDSWVKDTYYDTPQGVKEVALKYLCDQKRFDFRTFWNKIYYRYNNPEIRAILDTILNINPNP